MKYLITGGLGFIGSAFIRNVGKYPENEIINIDKITYAANRKNLPKKMNANYKLYNIDIVKTSKLKIIMKRFKPDAVLHFAAESHVDRSISNADEFIKTNIVGTYSILEVIRYSLESYTKKQKKKFRFIHISTDEVYGDIRKGKSSIEEDQYMPSSPYAASKAAADQLVSAWIKTYKIPTIITHCCNNFGPFQLPEKLIPLMILNALDNKKLPIYGNGLQEREWIHVDENIEIIKYLLKKGKIGNHYNISGFKSYNNIELVKLICKILDKIKPSNKLKSYMSLIKRVKDRPAHDKRYSLSNKKIQKLIKNKIKLNFEKQLENTIRWYMKNDEWLNEIKNYKQIRKRKGLL